MRLYARIIMYTNVKSLRLKNNFENKSLTTLNVYF